MKKLTMALLASSCVFGCAPDDESARGPAILELTPDLTRGKALYADTCEECHLVDGTGDNEDENLHLAFAAEDDETLIRVVLSGRRGTRMESFADYSNQELADVFAYAKSLAGK